MKKSNSRKTDDPEPRPPAAIHVSPKPRPLTTDQGSPVAQTDHSLKAGPRGPTLLEDFHLREKIMRFDHERIPERVVHARGAGAYGHFQLYESLERWTKAAFLCDPGATTRVFVRFSTVVGSRGSADTVRDVRGFATKFYTTEGNFDLVGNNIPVFFIQDGIRFPDLVHALKPAPRSEIPQAQSAHDTFWDFVSLVPESAHMVMWLMSDRAIPRSFSMMEGFGVHTFRLVNASGRSVFAKFHWKPALGVHSLVWDEAQELAGRDPDFHRRDLFEAIEKGFYPEFELGLQVVEENEADSLGIDLLDPTKVIPEEKVPVLRVGRMVLDRNPENFFAETEQVAFCVGNLVPGIDVTNDPLLQARLFSYLDTQLTRLGGPNFAEIPINRPIVPVANNQTDGFMRTTINPRRALYHPNSVDPSSPVPAGDAGFTHHPEMVAGPKARQRSKSFGDHFSQATLFFRSLKSVEQDHVIDALRFELSKVERKAIRERVVNEILRRIDPALAAAVASGIGVVAPRSPRSAKQRSGETSPALSQLGSVAVPRGRKIALLAADGVSGASVAELTAALEKAGVVVEVLAPSLAPLATAEGGTLEPLRTIAAFPSVLYDAVLIPDGRASVEALIAEPKALLSVDKAFVHMKPIGALGFGVKLLEAARIETGPRGKARVSVAPGVVVSRDGRTRAFVQSFLDALGAHRHWDRGFRAKKAAA